MSDEPELNDPLRDRRAQRRFVRTGKYRRLHIPLKNPGGQFMDEITVCGFVWTDHQTVESVWFTPAELIAQKRTSFGVCAWCMDTSPEYVWTASVRGLEPVWTSVI